MPEFIKTDPGHPLFLSDFPQACICGSQKGPIVATGITYRTVGQGTDVAHVYLCRLCVTRAARVLGMVKGEELDRLQNAADELAQAAREVEARQETIDRMTTVAGEREQKIAQMQKELERRDGELSTFRAYANEQAARAREMANV